MVNRRTVSWAAIWLPLTIVSVLTMADSGQAQSALKFKPPQRGTPPATSGAASRSGNSCVTGADQLAALAPKGTMGLTTLANPTLLVYVPPSSAQTLRVRLRASKGKTLYQADVPVQPGIVHLPLGNEATGALVTDQPYHWTVSLNCDETDRSANPWIEGWVERVQPSESLSTAIAQATPDNRPALYAEAGIWYDTVASLEALRQGSPHNAAILANWQSLLTSIGLTKFAQVPFVDCCTAPKQP